MSGARAEYQAAVDAYVAAGGDASVQRAITAISQVTKKLDQWYDRQLADLGISHGDWSVLSQLAKADGGPLTPSLLADAANLAPSSMTSRLDRMCARGLVVREPDQVKRTRVLVTLTEAGWELFAQAVREANVVESDVLADLRPEQRTTLADLLEVVLEGLDKHT
ncbi:putative MarR-family transcriptional regulator [Nostocoides australiense Ben110]|uniref:Putative MarR-family transcriptional regulator n=1 Tax=Nostocoides australiense Ben110 TaxID=1193182 RepID=W6JUV6_9MICO|nr:MarR family transcriptional regulator [Tetrasphaera australiensis]CCH72361.1 putative MarR-family transcriptional regulator [Tetrasphaera australiensis Ben110]